MKSDTPTTIASPLLHGYPSGNPVLAGLAMILGGGDPDEAMFQRDQALDTPGAFCAAAWQALAWMAWPHPITQGLIEQIAAIAATLPAQEQRDRWGEPLGEAREKAWIIARAQVARATA